MIEVTHWGSFGLEGSERSVGVQCLLETTSNLFEGGSRADAFRIRVLELEVRVRIEKELDHATILSELQAAIHGIECHRDSQFMTELVPNRGKDDGHRRGSDDVTTLRWHNLCGPLTKRGVAPEHSSSGGTELSRTDGETQRDRGDQLTICVESLEGAENGRLRSPCDSHQAWLTHDVYLGGRKERTRDYHLKRAGARFKR